MQLRLGLLAHGSRARLGAKVLGKAVAAPVRADVDQRRVGRPQRARDAEKVGVRFGQVLADAADALGAGRYAARDRVDRAKVKDASEDDRVAV